MKSIRTGYYLAGVITLIVISSCNPPISSTTDIPISRTNFATASTTPISITATPSLLPSPSLTEITLLTPSPSATLEPIATVGSLNAIVTADLLSCRYGPGSEYLFLYGLRKGANIELIGQTGGNNWVYVERKNKCWVNLNYIEISGDWTTLPVVYPGNAKLPVSPFYPPTSIRRVTRTKTQVSVEWTDIPLKAGDEEDASMQHYIIELWRCKGGKIIFDPLGTNDQSITFVDEPGCSEPSHGRIFVQEKHGFAGPTEIPWPVFQG
jgi:uncharacterized protein YraI